MSPGIRDLFANVGHSLRFSPPNYLRSLAGDSDSWKRESNPDTELQLLQREHFPGNLKTAGSLLLPAWPGKPSWLPKAVRNTALFRESCTSVCPMTDTENRFPEESWLFLNGIGADKQIADLNADCLYRLFGRPITLLHNQTHGLVLDLAECILGKGWLAASESVKVLFPAFYSELKRPDIERVVLIAHSQGTILAAVFIALLGELMGRPVTASREANCASKLLRDSAAPPAKTHARVLQQASGPSGCPLIDIDAAKEELRQALIGSVAQWLNWSHDCVLGLPLLTVEELSKLEIYCFATCASNMPYLVNGTLPLPYMEHFGNDRDLVARMGLFAPQEGRGQTRIDGSRWLRAEGWGHLLNAHYLQPLIQDWRHSHPQEFIASTDGNTESRLATYLQQ